MRSHATLAFLAALILQHSSRQITSALADDCFAAANWISPRSNSDSCEEGRHAWKQDDMTSCFASWRDYAGDEHQKECMPKPDDCRALADAIAKDSHKKEHLVIKWETGSGKNTPLAIWSSNDDTDCYKLHTAYGTCRFNFYVDAAPAEDGRKVWRTIRGDLASAIKASAAFFPGADTNAPNNEVDVQLRDGTYMTDDGKYKSEGVNNEVRARIWLDPADPSCKDRCGKIPGYCY